MKSIAWGAKTAQSKLERMEIDRPDPKDNEVVIEVLYTGVCHSDIHQVKNEWKNTVYPCIPGHEIVGRVTSTGAEANRFKTGDLVGVGCMIDSCRECEPCKSGDQNYCEGPNGWLATYNGPMTPAEETEDGANIYGRDNTFGGYSDTVVVPEDFVLTIPEGLDPKSAAPILCAGVTTWSPMQHWGVEKGDHVAVLGLGGLGHMAVKLAKAIGAKVTVLTSTPEKIEEAKRLGAEAAVIETDKTALAELEGAFDMILSTVPGERVMRPDFGCAMWDLLFAPLTAGTLGLVEQAPLRWQIGPRGRSLNPRRAGEIREVIEEGVLPPGLSDR